MTDEIRQSASHMKNVAQIFANSRFECQCFICPTLIGGVTQLVVARHGHLEPITWNDLQRVKTELFGLDSLAVEVYPQGLVREMKIRILWVLPEGTDLPYGLDKPSAWGGTV